MSVEEIIAVIVSVLGVWLTTRRSLWNYPFALTSVALYAHIFFGVKLYADMALQGIFAATLLYGLYQWERSRRATGSVAVARASRNEILVGVLGGTAVAFVIGALLAAHTDASIPWLDSALLAASLVGSVSASRRHIESWWIWIVVDTIYVGVYFYKALYLTAGLYAAFVLLAVLGLRRWKSVYATQSSPAAAGAIEGQAPYAAAAP